MGHWQPIAEENRKVRAERPRWPWWRRHGLLLVAVPLSAVLWARHMCMSGRHLPDEMKPGASA